MVTVESASAASWERPLDRYWASLCWLLPLALLSIPLAALARGNRPLAYALLEEDGLFESLGAVASLLAALVCWAACWRIQRHGAQLSQPASRLLVGLMGLAFFLLAGEEISWGQRLLRLETPEWIADINTQGELNLHNLRAIQPGWESQHLAVLLLPTMAAYFVVLPLLVRYTPRAGGWFRRLGWPVPSGYLAIGFVLNWTIAIAMGRALADDPVLHTQFDEAREGIEQFFLLLLA